MVAAYDNDDFKVEPILVETTQPNCGYDPSRVANTIHTTTRFDEYSQSYYECEEHYNIYGELIAKYETKIPVNKGCYR